MHILLCLYVWNFYKYIFKYTILYLCVIDLVYKELSSHMESCTHSHMLLILERVREQQEVIVGMNKSMKTMEEVQERSTAALASVQATMATTVAAVEISEKRAMKQMNERISALESKFNSKTSQATNSVRNVVFMGLCIIRICHQNRSSNARNKLMD